MSANDVIRFDCDHCGKTLKVPADKAGKQGKCPGCQKPILVPEPEIELDLPEEENSWIDEIPTPEVNRDNMTSTVGQHTEPPTFITLIKTELGGTVAIGIALIPWGMLVLTLLGIMKPTDSNNSSNTVMAILGVAVVVNLIALPIGIWRLRRAWVIMSRGIEIEAELLEYSTPITKNEISKGTFEYSYEGKTYHLVTTFATSEYDETHIVIVDPEKPGRALLKP